MSNSFQGKVAWISGASGALGWHIAQHLAAHGVRTVLSGRDADKLTQLARELGPSTRPVIAPLDVTSRESVDAAFAGILQETGHVDFLVNSTTLPLFGNLVDLDDAIWRDVFETKILGYIRTLRAALPHFVARRQGSIVNITGRGGRQPNPVHLPGGASNAAIGLITKGIADQYADQGIRANSLAPGPIRSARLDALQAASQPGSLKASVGEPLDIAKATLFLLSDSANHINGIVLPVDGGAFPGV